MSFARDLAHDSAEMISQWLPGRVPLNQGGARHTGRPEKLHKIPAWR